MRYNQLENLHQFDGRAKFSSWLYRIAYNQFLQHCRKQSSQKRAAELDELVGNEIDSDQRQLDEEQSESHLHRTLAKALSALANAFWAALTS